MPDKLKFTAKVSGSIAYVARDRHGSLAVYEIMKPKRDESSGCWLPTGMRWHSIDKTLFPKLKWEDGVKEVMIETTIIWHAE